MKSAPRKPRSWNSCAPKYSKIHGVIRRHSGLSKLRKPISAFLYSRLLTWANTIEKGLNPPRSFNSVSPVRNQPSGDPNCELFPQGLIIPVPPSTPLYRPVGIDGNNWVVFPGRDAKIMTTRIAGGLLLGCNPKGPRPGTQVPGLNFVQARWPLDAWRARRTGRVTSS